MLDDAIRDVYKRLRRSQNKLTKEKEQQEQQEQRQQQLNNARSTIQNALMRRVAIIKYKENLDKLREENLNKIDIVQKALNELLKIQKDISEGIIKGSDSIFNKINNILHKVNNSELKTSSRTSSRTSTGKGSRTSTGKGSRTSNGKDSSEIMMNNLKKIFICLADIWKKYIKYSDGNNTDKNKLTINLYFASYNIEYENITQLITIFKNNYKNISNACFIICSSEIKKLLENLKNSTTEKVAYETIIALLQRYIYENIKKPEEFERLTILQNTINELTKIKGGKLRKVRKTNATRTRTRTSARVVRNYKKLTLL